jgi:hypothetical protein
VKEVVLKINKHKEDIDTWKEKLKKVNILTHKINKEEEEAANEEATEEGATE